MESLIDRDQVSSIPPLTLAHKGLLRVIFTTSGLSVIGVGRTCRMRPKVKKCQLQTHAAQHTARIYSITSSARASNVGGTLTPIAFAALRLIASSYFVGACTGKSAGFSPLRMRSM